MPDYKANEQFWPKSVLLCHAAELALKAFVRLQGTKGRPLPAQQPHNHDLLGWYKLAVHFGLEHNADVEAYVSLFSELHRNSFMRYPEPMPKPAPGLHPALSGIYDLISGVAQKSGL